MRPPESPHVVHRGHERRRRHRAHSGGTGARHLAEATYWILSKQEPYREPKATAVSSTRDKRG
jgi:hypothetical protein